MKDVTWDNLILRIRKITSLSCPENFSYKDRSLFNLLVEHVKICLLSTDIEITEKAINEFEEWYTKKLEK